MSGSGQFQSLRFSGLIITIAAFIFQALPPLLELFGQNLDPDFSATLAVLALIPAIIVIIVLQGVFFTRALSNLALLQSQPVPAPGTGWLACVPFLNLLVLPWLTYTVHDRTQSLASSGHSSIRSGWLVLFWWAAFVGGFVLGSYTIHARGYDERESYVLTSLVVGLVGSWLTKKIVGEITNGQEQAAIKTGLVVN